MSWGHIVSKDLFSWTLAAVSPALLPDQKYEIDGVFTGCWIPPVDDQDKVLRVAYSSVKNLPFHWSTPPYPRDAAGIAVASSNDGGVAWEKSSQNPILVGEPAGLQVTGFRDPFVTAFPSINKARGRSEPVLYALISGGIEGVGPTTFLYEIEKSNLEEWEYLNPLIDMPLRFQPSKKWSGNYGVNWECTNLMTLQDGSEARLFLVIGAEGDVEKDHVNNYKRTPETPSRTVRAQLWMSGDLTTTSDGIKLQYRHGGYLDHGPYYAANSFLDPVSGRRIVYGWIPEEDIPLDAAHEKGWNGALALPREIFLLRIPNVIGTLHSQLSGMSPFELKTEPDGSTTVITLGVRPINELASARKSSQKMGTSEPLLLPKSDMTSQQELFRTSSASWELEATISIEPECEAVGFHLRHNEDLSIRTTVSFSIATETIVVERDASTTDPMINKCPDAGPFTLLSRQEIAGQATREKLQLRIFSDGDVLEVYANDRFALATMVYSRSYGPEFGGVTAFAAGCANSANFETVVIWDGLSPAK